MPLCRGQLPPRCADRRPHNVVGEDALRSYLYAGDLAVWLLKLLVEGQARRAYNAGSDKAVSTRNLRTRRRGGGRMQVVVKARDGGPPALCTDHLPAKNWDWTCGRRYQTHRAARA